MWLFFNNRVPGGQLLHAGNICSHALNTWRGPLRTPPIPHAPPMKHLPALYMATECVSLGNTCNQHIFQNPKVKLTKTHKYHSQMTSYPLTRKGNTTTKYKNMPHSNDGKNEQTSYRRPQANPLYYALHWP